jgi:glycosyltransferase involved in cell wall biosynthesis
VITTVPAVATPALRHGENVWLTPPADPVALAALIRQAAARTLPPLDTAAIEATAALFDWEGIAQRTVAFFTALGAR